MSALRDALKRVKRLPIAPHVRCSQSVGEALSTSGVAQALDAGRPVRLSVHRGGMREILLLEPCKCPTAVAAL